MSINFATLLSYLSLCISMLQKFRSFTQEYIVNVNGQQGEVIHILLKKFYRMNSTIEFFKSSHQKSISCFLDRFQGGKIVSMAKKFLEMHIIPSLYTTYVCIHQAVGILHWKRLLDFFFQVHCKIHILCQAHINIPCHAQKKKDCNTQKKKKDLNTDLQEQMRL